MSDFDRAMRVQAWDMYFSQQVSISRHPRAVLEQATTPLRSIEDCAAEADRMMVQRDLRFPVSQPRS